MNLSSTNFCLSGVWRHNQYVCVGKIISLEWWCNFVCDVYFSISVLLMLLFVCSFILFYPLSLRRKSRFTALILGMKAPLLLRFWWGILQLSGTRILRYLSSQIIIILPRVNCHFLYWMFFSYCVLGYFGYVFLYVTNGEP